MMRVLMVGVDSNRVGGMWTVAEQYLTDDSYNNEVKLFYVPTSTNGTLIKRICFMGAGYIRILIYLLFAHIDIVHIHMAEKGSTYRKGIVAYWAFKMHKKVIIHLHAGPFMKWYSTLSKKKKVIRSIFDCADFVIILGEYWKRELAEIVPIEKMRVLYNGLEVPEINLYNINGKNIVYFGVMNKAKGIYDLIKAVKHIDARLDQNITFLLCGNDLVGDVKSTIEKNGLNNRIYMAGWIKAEEKNTVFSDVVISVLPSYYEGLSMTVIEAMTRGIPMVATNISTMPELLGADVELIEPGDYKMLGERILYLVNNPSEREELSKKEYKRAKSMFSKKVFIQNTLNIYKELFEGDNR